MSILFGFMIRVLKLGLVLSLPFILLIRASVYVHAKYDPGPYLALLGGVGATVILLTLYMTFLYELFTNRLGRWKAFKNRIVFGLVILVGFCIQGLFFISSKNMKHDELSRSIRDLHPIVRVALNTVIFIDKDLLITDASRTPEDYRRMGLPTKSSSLHYKQKDGYSYAVDLRTNQRTALRNLLLEGYFKVLGFKTLRHVGTADHLHISLRCNYLPHSI